MADTYELWQRVERTDGRASGYQWMVWKIGPMNGEEAIWYESEDEARHCLARVLTAGPEGEPSDRELLDGFLASTEPVGPDEFVDEASGPGGASDA